MCVDTLHKGDNDNDDDNDDNDDNNNNNNNNNNMKVRLPYYGTNNCEPTKLLLTTNRTSKSGIMNKEHAYQYMLQFLETQMLSRKKLRKF
jgi:hypothetical protein